MRLLEMTWLILILGKKIEADPLLNCRTDWMTITVILFEFHS